MVLRSVPAHGQGSQRMWHVTVTVTGAPQSLDNVRDALSRLSHEHPFLLEARYGTDSAELRYWEEAEDIASATAVASAMWRRHEQSAALPHWDVVGVQVLDRQTYLKREPLRAVSEAGWLTPL